MLFVHKLTTYAKYESQNRWPGTGLPLELPTLAKTVDVKRQLKTLIF
jgi:hypothetical protein